MLVRSFKWKRFNKSGAHTTRADRNETRSHCNICKADLLLFTL